MRDRISTDRVDQFCKGLGLKIPILLAPMAGACPPGLSIKVANEGGMGACGALLMKPEQIHDWTREFRASSDGVFQLNNWIPDPEPARNHRHEQAIREFLLEWDSDVPADAADAPILDFNAQCEAMLEAEPPVISSIMGLYPDKFVQRMKSQYVTWFATVTTVGEALEAEAAGADVIVAQGMEAGGHRGTFKAEQAEQSLAGLFSLLPAVVDAVRVPVIATGGIADARGIAAAIILGASAVQIGTGFLCCPEAEIPSAWADAIVNSHPHQTMLTRSFSGRPGRSVATEFAKAAAAPGVPDPAPYPIQRALTREMTGTARRNNDLDRMQAWCGQSGYLANELTADVLIKDLWKKTQKLLS